MQIVTAMEEKAVLCCNVDAAKEAMLMWKCAIRDYPSQRPLRPYFFVKMADFDLDGVLYVGLYDPTTNACGIGRTDANGEIFLEEASSSGFVESASKALLFVVATESFYKRV